MKKNTYIARDKSQWSLWYDCLSVPVRSFDWVATHVDYDGCGDHRYLYAETREELIKAIDELVMEEVA
jgi:hypothetical protein